MLEVNRTKIRNPGRTMGKEVGKPIKPLGFEALLEAVFRVQAQAVDSSDLDRMRVLETLERELGVDHETLLLAGFDKAYRRMVEGV